MGDTYLWLKRELFMSDAEIKDLTVPKLNMLLQRNNEPVYKNELDQKLYQGK